MSKNRHFYTAGLLLLLTASASVGWVAAQDTDKKIPSASTPVSFLKYVDLGEGWQPRFPAGLHGGAVARELRHIILSKVDLRDVPFSDAIAYFQQTFSDHDPKHCGMSFFVKLPRVPVAIAGPPSPGTSRSPEPRVTLKLRKVRYSDALDKLATAAGMKWMIDTYAIAFVPLSESTEPLFTAERAASPKAVGFPADTKSWLESRGVDFPPGASAKYLSDSHKLVVRQTQANLGKIRLIITSQDRLVSTL